MEFQQSVAYVHSGVSKKLDNFEKNYKALDLITLLIIFYSIGYSYSSEKD